MADEGVGPRYHWWRREDLEAEGFSEMYASDAWVRMEFHPHGTDTMDKPAIRLIGPDGEVCGEYDATQTCPPDCTDDDDNGDGNGGGGNGG